eukprot:CAMPEP_0183526910 /NCGR_PEP_ID=MMETSP0371-20130417/21655_1 /TAXON_ID=268820 /ORGANISM="Peridinium aciculiferum, Strain PAER-2" /LENGTH=47 /DNA_ID= /DNA_START= /DNA_END= /DNA_ORIENTATION=
MATDKLMSLGTVTSPVDNSLTLLLGMKVPPSTPHHGATGRHAITPSP